MKTTKYIYILAVAMLAFTACKKYDNYDEPDAGVHGKIIDAETGNTIETKQPGGGSVRFLQWNPKYPSPQPLDVSIKADGNYSVKRFFADKYKAFPLNGPFMYSGDSVEVSLTHNGDAELNFEVVPYYRIEASVVDSTFTYTINRSAFNTSKLVEIRFMINNYPIVNEDVSSNFDESSYYLNSWRVFTEGTPDNELLGMSRTFTFNFSRTRWPKGDYYFRVAARAANSPNSTYNYSPVIKATVR
ncbi:MAG: DUF3823 domain-containing protein [Sphingobacteriaceae bacterium]|nr:MAG: DUF3823 domain-containing protein [Sphingobacteriaceae bacterium]